MDPRPKDWRRRAALALVPVLILAGLAIRLTGNTPPAGAGAVSVPILGTSELNAAQLSTWFKVSTRSAYRASVSVETLASLFISEGQAANVRGDVAFVQSIIETGWFNFPDGGYVRPGDNNFAGIGAYGNGSALFRAPTAQEGVRGQIQLLRRYADSSSTQWNIGYSPVAELWNPASRYDVPGGTHGWAPTWGALSGRWASAPNYGDVILRQYDNALRSFGKSIASLSTTPIGAFDGVRVTPDGIRAAGWALGPSTSQPINVDFYLNGQMVGRVPASGFRPDVGAAFPGYGDHHGYDVTIPGTGGTLCIYGIDPVGTSNVLLGPGCRNVIAAPVGTLDSITLGPGGIRATGWSIAPGTTQPVNVDFYLNGAMIGRVTASGSRPDVGAVYPRYGAGHGYDVTIPSTGGTLCVYGIDPVGTNNELLGPGCRTVTSGPPFGSLDRVSPAPGGLQVAGWSIALGTTSPISVDFYVNGTMVGRVTAGDPRSDVGAAFPLYGRNHGYDVVVPFAHGTICSYGIDPTGGRNTLLGPGCVAA